MKNTRGSIGVIVLITTGVAAIIFLIIGFKNQSRNALNTQTTVRENPDNIPTQSVRITPKNKSGQYITPSPRVNQTNNTNPTSASQPINISNSPTPSSATEITPTPTSTNSKKDKNNDEEPFTGSSG